MDYRIGGWFVFTASADGWSDSFTVEDDDGMPFALDGLRPFHGRPVRVTIEVDDTLQPDLTPTAYIYEQSGLTAKNIREKRDVERAILCRPGGKL